MIGIYKITSPTGKIYVGQSRNIEKRFLAYKRKNAKGQHRLHRSFVKYGFKNHVFEIIEECDFIELNKRERYWQDYYNVISDSGLNCLLTETSVLPREITEETRKNMSTSSPKYWLGKKKNTEFRLKISKAGKGISKPPRSKEHRENISKSKLGNKNGMYNKKGSLNPASKKVYCEFNNTKYDSIRECANALNLHENTIYKHLKGISNNKYNIIYI